MVIYITVPMKPLSYALIYLCFTLNSIVAIGTNYFISATGNDSNTGTSISSAWNTILKLNTISLQAGDTVFFEGSCSFSGTVYLDGNDMGDPTSPVVFTSYGLGKGIINAGTGFGFKAYNSAGFEFRELEIKGAGPEFNSGSGIDLYMDTAVDLEFIHVVNCNISGFGNKGIEIGCWDTFKGFSNVIVESVSCFDNGRGGMGSYGFNTNYNHKNFHVTQSEFYNNKGIASITSSHTGSGIVLSGIDGALIEKCEAFNNGENSSNPSGGPVGIWFYIVKNGIIQHCESHHNKTATIDGGGFDIDGGSQNCIIQYCFSHDNYGPGFLLAEYGSGVPYTGNVIRYNISQNDGRKASAGAITLWAANAGNKILNSQIYNNTVYSSVLGIVNGGPSAVKIIGQNFSAVKFFNNIFHTLPGIRMIDANMNLDSSAVHFVNNNYYGLAGLPSFHWNGGIYPGLPLWKLAAPGQERIGAQSFGLSFDPLLVAPGITGTIGVVQLPVLETLLGGYMLNTNSAMLDAGLDLSAVAGIDIGNYDFFGNASKTGISQDIGAHECFNCYSVLKSRVRTFTATRISTGVILKWNVDDQSSIQNYILESGDDPMVLNTKLILKPGTQKSNYQLDTTPFSGNRFYRLKVISVDGSISYSIIRQVTGQANPIFKLIQNPIGESILFSIITPRKQFFNLELYNEGGMLLERKKILVTQEESKHEWKLRLNSGIYILRIFSDQGDDRSFRVVRL